MNKVSTEGTELVDGTVAARVDLLDGKLVPHALVDSGTEITVIKKDLVPGISVEGASTIYLKGIFGPAVKCPLVYVPIGIATGGQVNVVHQQVLCALAEVLVEDVLLPPDVLDMLGGAQSEENSLAQSSQDLRVDSGNVDETEVSSGILPEKAQEHIEDYQRNITSCRNEVGTLGTKDEEVTAEMDKGIMVADSFRSEQECCAELALVWKYAKEGKGNYYEVDGYLFGRDKILGESIGQLVIPKCRRTEVLKLAHTSVFSSHMGLKKTIERIKYSFFWEGLKADVKKFCESCKECQLTRSVRIKDRPPITPVARPELPFQVVNMDLIGPIDPPSSKGHKYILCLVDQHTRWGEAVPLTSLSAKVACEAFVKLKELPCEVTSLATPDANLPFQVHCDASDYGVGCCLIQQDTEGIYRPIAFASQKFNATQKNWASIEKEAWAVLYGLNKFDKWIYGAKVEIISDHNPLKYVNQTTPKSPKLTRWALALQRWNHPITHRPGTTACIWQQVEQETRLRRGSGNERKKRSERERRRGGEEKAVVVKSRHGWTMYGNPITSECILDFKKCPIEVLKLFLQIYFSITFLSNLLFSFAARYPDGHGYELVSSVRALVPQKFSVEEELMHVKHVEVKSPHVGVMWKFGRGVISSGFVPSQPHSGLLQPRVVLHVPVLNRVIMNQKIIRKSCKLVIERDFECFCDDDEDVSKSDGHTCVGWEKGTTVVGPRSSLQTHVCKMDLTSISHLTWGRNSLSSFATVIHMRKRGSLGRKTVKSKAVEHTCAAEAPDEKRARLQAADQTIPLAIFPRAQDRDMFSKRAS
ncbi:retrovirus-related Pol polyprotein from transposon opus [Trichonephila clavipes]|nr:retrovirus-related Pol polyprotein from transposon opus [Trichonephila clavipes]